MSIASQEKNMRRLAALLNRDLSYNYGERECGPSDEKRAFLNAGKAFLRALAKDLGLQNARIASTPGGIAVSGECSLRGVWGDSGIYIQIGQFAGSCGNVLLYRSILHEKDYVGGCNNYLTRRDLERLTYSQLLEKFSAIRKEAVAYERAA